MIKTIIRQEGYAEFPDGKLLPSSEDVECIELAVKELAGGAEMSEQQHPAVDVEGLAKVITYVLEMRSALADDPQLRKVAQDIAETTLSHVGAELAAVRSQLDGARDGRDLYFKLYEKEKSKADAYQKDWYAAKSEFGDAMGKMRDKVRELEAERDGARNELAEAKRERADYGDKMTARTGELENELSTLRAKVDEMNHQLTTELQRLQEKRA